MSGLYPDVLVQPYDLAGAIVEPFLGVSPAAGADFSLTMEGRYTTRLLSVHVRLVTDANAANREVVLEYRDDQNLRFRVHGAPVTWPATSTVDYEFAVNQEQYAWPVDTSVLVPLSPLFLPAGWNFRIHVVNIQVTDQLSAIRGTWERFPTDGPR